MSSAGETTQKKYEFTGEKKVVFGVTLCRIRSLIEIDGVVERGVLGGWLEREENLSAQVSDRAWVSGEARVSGEAQVSGEAKLTKTAEYLLIGPIGSRNATMTAWEEKGVIQIATGCYLGSIEDFLKKVNDVHQGNQHHEAYAAAIKFIIAKFKSNEAKS